jgi:hypothetical protein
MQGLIRPPSTTPPSFNTALSFVASPSPPQADPDDDPDVPMVGGAHDADNWVVGDLPL